MNDLYLALHTGTHDGLDHVGPLQSQASHSVKDVHHTLSLQPLQQDVHSYEGAGAATPTTRKGGGTK